MTRTDCALEAWSTNALRPGSAGVWRGSAAAHLQSRAPRPAEAAREDATPAPPANSPQDLRVHRATPAPSPRNLE
jgi:hypothetical protein